MQFSNLNLEEAINAFLKDDPPHLVLDIRSARDFQAKHLNPSLNLPARMTTVAHLGYQLPSKQVPFAILGGSNLFEQPGDEKPEEYNSQLQSERALLTWIRENGWSVPFVFNDRPEFWDAMEKALQKQYQDYFFPPRSDLEEQAELAREGIDDVECRPWLGILTHQDGRAVLLPSNMADSESPLQRRQRKLYRPYLFKPNPWLAKTISIVENELMQARSSTSWRCLDLGCGAGRDMTYLVSRAVNCLRPTEHLPRWTVLGIDSFIGACEKMALLARTTLSYRTEEMEGHLNGARGDGYVENLSTLVAKVDSKTGVLWVDKTQLEHTYDPPFVLPNVRYRDHDLDERCTAALSSNNESPQTAPLLQPTAPFDLIVMIRFLERQAMSAIVNHWLAPGGFVLLSHFVQDKDLPVYTKPGPHHRLQSKTEARDWLTRLGLQVVMDEISTIEDGRPVSNVLARKPLV